MNVEVEALSTTQQGWGKTMNLKVGDIVTDDLTQTRVKITKITQDDEGNVGIWVDNNYLEGGRYPWEITTNETSRSN